MGELRELYQEVILDHSKGPRNFGELAGANRRAEGYNPLCGDRETVFVRLEEDVLKEVGFRGAGCAISTASASMMTESLKGKTRAEAEALSSASTTSSRGRMVRRSRARPSSGSSRSSPECASFPCGSSARPCRGTP